MVRTGLIAALLTALLSAGCGGQAEKKQAPPVKAEPGVNWSFAAKALEVTFVSDPFLNEYQGASHSLDVWVYQLEDAEGFRRMAASARGMAALAEGRGPDQGVVSAKRVTVRPGRNETLAFDRNEKTRYLGVACAYFGLDLASCARVYEVPVGANTSGWLWWKTTTYAPDKLSRQILLGKSGIVGDGS